MTGRFVFVVCVLLAVSLYLSLEFWRECRPQHSARYCALVLFK